MMWMKKIILCILIAVAIKCNAKVNSSRRTVPNSFIHAEQLLSMCFPDDLSPVVVADNLINVVYKIPKNGTIDSSVVVIGENFSSTAIQKYYPRHPSFVLPGDNINILEKTLREIKSAEIWNVKSMFLIIGTQCQNAAPVLKLTWSIEALASFFICPDDSRNGTLIYTYNPFSNYAPEFWKKEEMNGELENKWTLFRQPFINDSKICKSINFDKSKQLNSFPVKGILYSQTKRFSSGKVPKDMFDVVPLVYYTLFDNLQTELNTRTITHSTNVFFDFNKIFLNSTYDVNMTPMILRLLSVKYNDILPFFDQNGFIILTQKQSTVPIMSLVVDNFFNFWTATMSCIILVIILIFIYVSNNRILSEAFLDLLALLLGMGLMVPFNKLSMRIMFFSVTLFMLIFNPALQGHVSSILTKPGRRQIETLEDLYQNKFHLHYNSFIYEELLATGLWSTDSDKQYLHKLSWGFFDCIDRISKNPSAACLMDDFSFPDTISENIHLSSNVYFKNFVSLSSRKNWPLNGRFDKATLNFFETGQADYFERKSLFTRLLRKKKLIARIEASEQYDQLDFGHLGIDYILLPLIIFSTALMLIIEILYKKFQIWNEKRLRELEFKRLRARWRIVRIARRMANLAQAVHEV